MNPLSGVPLVFTSLPAWTGGALALAAPAVPAEGLLLPWGEWVGALMQLVVHPLLLSAAGGLSAWLVARLLKVAPWLQALVTAEIVERVLTNLLDYGVNAVVEASKGRQLEASTGRAVLDCALQRGLEVLSPAMIDLAGGLPELAAKMFRKMDLAPGAGRESVLDPVLAGLGSPVEADGGPTG